MTDTPRRIIRSAALDAITAKEHETRYRLSVDFLAFVQPTPEKARTVDRKGSKKKGSKSTSRKTNPKKHTLGWIVWGTVGERSKSTTENFSVFLVGNPSVQVQEISTVLAEFYASTEENLDVRDAHASRILFGVKSYMQFVLEDKDESRGLGVEVLFVDYMGSIRWCAYDGSDGDESVSLKTKKLILRGCYDEAVRREIRRILKTHIQDKKRPTRNSLKLMVRELKNATRLKNVSFSPITM